MTRTFLWFKILDTPEFNLCRVVSMGIGHHGQVFFLTPQPYSAKLCIWPKSALLMTKALKTNLIVYFDIKNATTVQIRFRMRP